MMVKRLGLVFAVLVVLGLAAFLSLPKDGRVIAGEMPPIVEVGGGFSELVITTTNALGNEPVHYYLGGTAQVVTPTWTVMSSTAILPGMYSTTITGTARWDSLKIGDILSTTSESDFWTPIDNPGWFERMSVSPTLEVGGMLSNSLVLTSTFGYGDEQIFVGGIATVVLPCEVEWMQIDDGVYTATLDTEDWQSFKVGFDKPQSIEVVNPYWMLDAEPGWIVRSGYVPPVVRQYIYLPLLMRPLIVSAPEGFCKGGTPWVVPGGGNVGLTNPSCGAGEYIVHLDDGETRYDVFQEVAAFIAGREATIWFEPADW